MLATPTCRCGRAGVADSHEDRDQALNSFGTSSTRLGYEVVRQARALDAGERLVQETRLWDPDRARTVSMRSKEFAHDYRYFPEPDLPPLHVEPRWIDELGKGLPELPAARRARFALAYGLSAYDAELLTQGRGLADYFEEATRAHGKPKIVANWILNELLRELPGDDDAAVAASPVPPGHLVGLLALIDDGSISGRIAKDVFEKMYRSGEAAGTIVRREGLTQVADAGALATVVDEVLAANPKVVADLQAGKKAALGFLVGRDEGPGGERIRRREGPPRENSERMRVKYNVRCAMIGSGRVEGLETDEPVPASPTSPSASPGGLSRCRRRGRERRRSSCSIGPSGRPTGNRGAALIFRP